jgi:two-component system, OmpR family, response regulator ArlR
MRVLIVEDDKYIAKAVAEILKKNNYTVDLVYNGEEGLDYALSDVYDIVILDIMLPKKDGLTILKEIRKTGIDVPVILLTAKGQIEDKVKGLDLGADDYLPKPFHPDELLARLRALGRRKPEFHNDGILTFGDFQLAPHTLVLSCGGREIKLKLKEAQILELLITNRNQIISKDTIIERVWGYDADACYNQVESHISRLRKAISQIQSNINISVIRGEGYVLCSEEKGGK